MSEKLTVFDPSMCCSTGVCGPDVDPELARFSSDLEWLEEQGVEVERYNLAQEPGAFADDSDAKGFLEQQGESELPLLKVDSEVVDHGDYPDREILADWFDLDGGDAETSETSGDDADSGGCCSGGDNEPDIKDQVRESYGKIATDEQSGCCGPSTESTSSGSSCCGGGDLDEHAAELGYDFDDLGEIPEDANLGLGCGNPTAIANLEPGQVVLDLGSGAGMDAFLAASKVGEEGRVIGVDMTPEMLARARRTAVEQGVADRVEFREGEIEQLPVVSERVDVVLSNCVVNLSPDEPAVFREAFRVLKPGGRLAITDICLDGALPDSIREAAAAHVACIGGAMQAEDYLEAIREAGFTDLDWSRTSAAPMFESIRDDSVLSESLEALGDEGFDALEEIVWSYRIRADKP